MPTYSYDVNNLTTDGKDKMRLELGDTTFAPGELTAALCDEEYTAIINANTKWKKAKLACLKAILMRFSHQVNFSCDGLSYSFADRVNFWKGLYDELKSEVDLTVPLINQKSLKETTGGHYFHKDMQKNW